MPLDAVAGWLDALARDPKHAVADLLAGRLDRGQFARLECAEFMQRALADAVPDAEVRARLDEGLSAWLAEAMARDAEWRRSDGVQAHLYRLNEAFAAVSLLRPPRTAYRLRELSPAYRRWLQRYDYGYGDGPYAGYWRALAGTQGDDAGLRRQWHEFVVQAGGQRYPRYLFQVGMAGLRGLPIDTEQRQLATINALLRRAWRIGSDDALADFAERLSALRAEYPMANDTWRGRVLRVVQLLEADEDAHRKTPSKARQSRDAGRLAAFKAKLGQAVKPVIGDLALGEATARSVTMPAMPTIQEFDKVKSELSDRHPMAIKHALELFEAHHAYAEASGDSYFFVRTLCNLGHRLLKQPGLDAGTLDSLRALLRHALVWGPDDPYPWSFWAELEQTEGREDIAETVLWEAVRRFPDDEPSRVELALLLQRRHARDGDPALLAEAEQLLREAVAANPRNEASRVELALLLQRRHARDGDPARLAEAEQLLRAVVAANPRNLHSRSELARLLARNGRTEPASALLKEGLAGRDNPIWRRMLADIEAGKTLPLPKLDLKQPKPAHSRPTAAPASETLDALRANAAAARYAYARERGEAGDSASLATAAGQYDLPRFYLTWFGQIPAQADAAGSRPPYALAALDAIAAPEHWPALERDYPQYQRDTVLLKLYAGVPVAAEARAELADWLEESADAPEAAEAVDDLDADETDAPPTATTAGYDDFPRRSLRELDFLNACERSPAGLATASRSGEFDRLIEKLLARTVEADLPPVALVA